MLNAAYSTLLKESGSEASCQLSTALGSEVMPWNTLSASEAEVTAMFCICVLAEIGNAKNNIIGVGVSSFYVNFMSHAGSGLGFCVFFVVILFLLVSAKTRLVNLLMPTVAIWSSYKAFCARPG